jgi:uncharacterized repeat protein (TIGR03803 family)
MNNLQQRNNLSKSYAVSVSPFEFVFGVTLAKAFAYVAAIVLLLSFSLKSNSQEVLAGLTSNGGPQGKGTLFNISTNGTGFAVINGFQDWGKNPNGGLVLGSDGNFYGMTNVGGTYGYGTIFKMTPAGAITVLHHFDYTKDGANPYGDLTLARDGNFYGLTSAGGTNTYGTIFKITTAGVFTVMRHFSYNTDGANPRGQMVVGADSSLYGITYRGGANGAGTIFKFKTTGTYTVIKSLTTATDGVNAQGSLVLAKDGNFYGITYGGGANNYGTIFKVTPTGTFTVIRHLVAADGSSSRSTLVQAPDGFLYGMAYGAGVNGNGTIFKISTTGTFSVLRSFVYTTDGGLPNGSLIVGIDGSLYGTTSGGGPNRAGTIFKITTAGVYTVLRSLTLTTDGGAPKGTLVKGADGNYYGLTSDGGASLFGTAFKITAAGVYTVLAKFSGSGGSAPFESLIQAADNGLYGTTSTGGTYNYGTIFKLCGGVTTTMFSFNRSTHGAYPKGSLIQAADSSFYGTTSDGGTNGFGTIFKITRTGAFTVLRHLTAADGGYPQGSLVQGSNGLLYGMTSSGGTNSIGVIFSISTTGVYKIIKQLTAATDGANPEGSLAKGTDSFFFGMTTSNGRIFKIAPGGTYSVLSTFVLTTTGNNPTGNLVLGKDGNFYGMCAQGGSSGKGTIFKVTPTGTLTVLRHLNGTTDGGVPKGSLVQAADGNFYGMTSAGGTYGVGTIFRISATGVFAVIRQLNMAADGGSPLGALIIQKPVTLVATAQSIATTEDIAKAVVLAGTGGSPLTFTVVTQPKNGTVNTGTAANRTYTPKANYSGKDSFYFTANVGCQSSPPAKVLINITAVNDTPVLAAIGSKTVKAGVNLTFTATATDPDAGQTKTFSLITPPTGATIAATTGVFNWTPTATGTFTFKVRVTDNGSPVLFDEEQITVTVTATLSAASNSDITEIQEKAFSSSLKGYPNPSRDKYTVVLPEPVSKVSAAIFDIHGARINNWTVTNAGSGRYDFNISNIPSGEYVVRLTSEHKSWVVKFLKL